METSPEVVRRDVLRSGLFDFTYSLDAEGRRKAEEKTGLLDLATKVVSQRRASLNDLKGNFLDYKRDEGFTVVEIPRDEDAFRRGRDQLAKGKSNSLADRVESVLNADKLTEAGIESFLLKEKSGQQLASLEINALNRATVEAFYRCSVSYNLVENELKNRPRPKIEMFEALSKPDWRTAGGVNSSECNIPMPITSDMSKADCLRQILLTTPVYDGLTFDGDKAYSKDDLLPFARYVSNNSETIQSVLGVKIRGDLHKMPTRQFADFIGMVNLRHSNCKGTNEGRKKKYYYKLDLGNLNYNLDVMGRRKSIEIDNHEIEIRELIKG